jgi:hypothetical protein
MGAPGFFLEQFQQKCVAVLRPELRENKEIEYFRGSEKNGNALDGCRWLGNLERGQPGRPLLFYW